MVGTAGQEPGNKGTCISRVSIVIIRANTCKYLMCQALFWAFTYGNAGNHHNIVGYY